MDLKGHGFIRAAKINQINVRLQPPWDVFRTASRTWWFFAACFACQSGFQAQQTPFGENGVRATLKAEVVRLSLGDFAALDAAGADADALGSAVDQSLDGLQVDVPATPRDVVRVRDVVTELRAFAANVAYLCHDFTPNLMCFVPPRF